MASPYIQPPPGLVTPPGLCARSDLSVFSGFSPIIYQSGGILYYEDLTTGTMMTMERPGAPHWTDKYDGQPVYTPTPRENHSKHANIQARKHNSNTTRLST
jgi:hypothetical protein